MMYGGQHIHVVRTSLTLSVVLITDTQPRMLWSVLGYSSAFHVLFRPDRCHASAALSMQSSYGTGSHEHSCNSQLWHECAPVGSYDGDRPANSPPPPLTYHPPLLGAAPPSLRCQILSRDGSRRAVSCPNIFTQHDHTVWHL